MIAFQISEAEIQEIVSKIKGKLSAGYDEIPKYPNKDCIKYIKNLCFIFNSSLNSDVFPELMKIAKVRPIHKKGNKNEISNYRPIYILAVFANILEKLVYNRIISFVNKRNIFNNTQN
jgi:potassium voltage-gated channel Eag-related subfamily H protein 8